jgi:2,3-dihydroxybenzoate decarboxylase
MPHDRRTALKQMLAAGLAIGSGVGTGTAASGAGAAVPAPASYRRVALEEAWVTPEIVTAYRKILANPPHEERGFAKMWGRYVDPNTTSPLLERLLDVDKRRIADMDSAGIDKQLLLLTAPGVQVFEADLANKLAADSNDQAAEAVKRHPDRLAASAAFAPQDPKAAAKEIERATTALGLTGAVVNSHTKGEYLDDPKHWEIFEALEALDAPLYIHPRTPDPGMIDPMLDVGFERGMFGFGVDVAFHTLRIITSGALDRFPDLKIVIGHAGEGLPYWMYRLDTMAPITGRPQVRNLKMKISDYMKRNLYITTSGVPWAPAITMAQQVMGVDHVLYAMDYPYQFVPEEVTMTDNFPISAADKVALFEGNAKRIYGI